MDPTSEVEFYLQGTRDSKVHKKEHSYLVYEFVKCTNEDKVDGDPDCAELETQNGVVGINDWLENKKMRMRVLNENVDFNGLWDEGTMRTNEMWLPSVSLGGNVYVDNGYRIR